MKKDINLDGHQVAFIKNLISEKIDSITADETSEKNLQKLRFMRDICFSLKTEITDFDEVILNFCTELNNWRHHA